VSGAPHQALDSSQRGFVAPGPGEEFSLDDADLGLDEGFWNTPPVSGSRLDDIFQQIVAGIVGLDGPMVRPRFQAEPPDLPEFGSDWVAVGVMARRPIGFVGAVKHDPRGEGRSWLQRHEYLDVLASFYGPEADGYAERLHDGFMIAQNREVLYLNQMGFIEVLQALRVPEYIKNRWTERYDVRFTVSRIRVVPYPIRSFASAAGQVITNP
jgi:hypothetical protein